MKARTSAISKAAPRRCAMRISFTRRSWNWSRWTMRRSNTAPCRTGIPATKDRQGRDLQLRHQARQLPRRQQQDQLDAGRDRHRDHLEISKLHPAGRQQRRRVLLGRADQPLPAGRHRHEDDPHRQEHQEHDRVARESRAGHGQNTYRGLVKILKGATNSRNYTQCDSLLLGDKCGAHTFPYIEVRNTTSQRRARSQHEQDRRGSALLLQDPRHQRSKTRSA